LWKNEKRSTASGAIPRRVARSSRYLPRSSTNQRIIVQFGVDLLPQNAMAGKVFDGFANLNRFGVGEDGERAVAPRRRSAIQAAGQLATATRSPGQPAATAALCHAGSATSSASLGPASVNDGVVARVIHVIHGVSIGHEVDGVVARDIGGDDRTAAAARGARPMRAARRWRDRRCRMFRSVRPASRRLATILR